MAKQLQKLELTWIGKGNEPQLAPLFVPRKTEAMDDRYKNPDDDNRGLWTSSDLTVKTYAAAND